MVTQLARRNAPVVTPTRVVVGILLVAPFIGTLWVSSYSREEPRLGGFPFFYWYQFLWILLSALFTSCAYVLVQREKRARAAHTPSAESGGADDGPATGGHQNGPRHLGPDQEGGAR